MLGTVTKFGRTWSKVRPLHRQWRALLVALLGIALSFVAAEWLHRRELKKGRAAFERRATSMQLAIAAHFDAPLASLRAVPLLFSASTAVEEHEFASFVRSTLKRERSVAFLAWAPEVTQEQREVFERQVRSAGWSDFSLREQTGREAPRAAAQRSRYMPLLHLEPKGTPLLGVDLLASPERAEAVRRALAEEEVMVAPGFDDAADVLPETFLAFAPLSVEPSEAPVDPRAARRGVAVIALRIAALVHDAVTRASFQGLDFVLADATEPGRERVLFESSPGAALLEAGAVDAVFESPVHYGGRRWVYRFLARPDLLSAGPSPYVTSVLGGVLSLMAMLAVGSLEVVRRLRWQVEATGQVGQYRLIRKLGEGGMGVVYQAEHSMLRRPTAIKVIAQRTGESDLSTRFEREVKLTSKLTHPNTIVVFDFGRTPEGVFYYAMEYLPGATVEELVRAVGPLSPARVVHLLRQVCGSLSEAHRVGLVHRDIKPSNLMVCERGGIADFIKVLDFGLVKDISTREATHYSQTGHILGTPQYMAPETLRGQTKPSPAVDIYAVGAVAYYMLTGHDAFEASSLSEVIVRQLEADPPRPSTWLGHTLPADLEAVVLRCLAKDPEARPSSTAALLALLDACEVPAWTQDDARRFWAERGASIASRAPLSGDVACSETLAVDLAARQASAELARAS